MQIFYNTGRIVIVITLICLTACTDRQRLDRVLSESEIVVVTRNAPTTYYEGRDGETGLEY